MHFILIIILPIGIIHVNIGAIFQVQFGCVIISSAQHVRREWTWKMSPNSETISKVREFMKSLSFKELVRLNHQIRKWESLILSTSGTWFYTKQEHIYKTVHCMLVQKNLRRFSDRMLCRWEFKWSSFQLLLINNYLSKVWVLLIFKRQVQRGHWAEFSVVLNFKICVKLKFLFNTEVQYEVWIRNMIMYSVKQTRAICKF